MKPDHVYHELKHLAEKLGIAVQEHNLRNVGIHVSSGLCRIKDQQVFVMDKRLSIREKTEILAECLGKMDLEGVYIVPAIRELLNKYQS
ncbi:MAG: hypothetical protein SWH68_02290 [Thermodesulfobacteriota bacterium]|nr:hypothetical protein [Thermodesulfobacteriota bacterium]